MWISEESSTRSNIDWLRTHYPDSARFSSMIFEDEEDVLRPEVVRAMYRVRTAVDSLVTPVHGDRWRDLCQPIPVVKPPNLVRQMRSNIDDIFYLENRCSNFFFGILMSFNLSFRRVTYSASEDARRRRRSVATGRTPRWNPRPRPLTLTTSPSATATSSPTRTRTLTRRRGSSTRSTPSTTWRERRRRRSPA